MTGPSACTTSGGARGTGRGMRHVGYAYAAPIQADHADLRRAAADDVDEAAERGW